MSEEYNRKKARTIAVSFPHTEEGDMVYEKLMERKHEEDRSCSKIIYRLLRSELTGDDRDDYVIPAGANPLASNGRSPM
jgi:hypothetical protein